MTYLEKFKDILKYLDGNDWQYRLVKYEKENNWEDAEKDPDPTVRIEAFNNTKNWNNGLNDVIPKVRWYCMAKGNFEIIEKIREKEIGY